MSDCPLITVDEIAADLGCSKGKVFNLLHAGAIPHSKNGRMFVINRAEYQKWRDGSLEVSRPNPSPTGMDLRVFEGWEVTIEVTARLVSIRPAASGKASGLRLIGGKLTR